MLLQMAIFHSFLWLMFYCMYVSDCVFAHTHTLPTRSSVNTHVGCFYVLAIVNSATVNTGLHVSFQISFL